MNRVPACSSRRGENEVEILGAVVGLADGHHRQAARRTGRFQTPSEGQGLRPAAPQIHDGGFDLQIRQGGDACIGPAGRDGAPAETVETLGQGTRQLVVSRDNQNPRLDACGHSLHL